MGSAGLVAPLHNYAQSSSTIGLQRCTFVLHLQLRKVENRNRSYALWENESVKYS